LDTAGRRAAVCQAQQVIDAVFLNGTVGAGKTTVAEALADLERDAARSHALIDTDQIRRVWPSPPGDPFTMSSSSRTYEQSPRITAMRVPST